jgi:hypothetical protein
MRILIDTNIFIYREDYRIIPPNLIRLLQILNRLKVEILIHPKSVEEIKKDYNEDRKKVVLSKLDTVEYDYYFASYQKIFSCYSLHAKNNPKTAAIGIFRIKAIPGLSLFI